MVLHMANGAFGFVGTMRARRNVLYVDVRVISQKFFEWAGGFIVETEEVWLSTGCGV